MALAHLIQFAVSTVQLEHKIIHFLLQVESLHFSTVSVVLEGFECGLDLMRANVRASEKQQDNTHLSESMYTTGQRKLTW